MSMFDDCSSNEGCSAMSLETYFNLTNIVMPFWLLMIFVPFWGWTARIMRSPWVAVVPTVIYAVLVLPNMGGVFAAVSNPSLEGITALLGTPEGATIAWAHFLAFDLLVGRWIYLDSRERGIAWWWVSPLLFLTLMLGPVGFGGYLLLRAGFAFAAGRPMDALVDKAA
jgi:hypothetical protein